MSFEVIFHYFFIKKKLPRFYVVAIDKEELSEIE